MDPFETAKKAATTPEKALDTRHYCVPASEQGNPFTVEAQDIIFDAHDRAQNLYDSITDPYRRKSARAWLCSDQCHLAEDALTRQFHRLVAAGSMGEAGEGERTDALSKFAEGSKWWLNRVAGKLGVKAV